MKTKTEPKQQPKQHEKHKLTPERVTAGEFLWMAGSCRETQRLAKYGTDLETVVRVVLKKGGGWRRWMDSWVAENASGILPSKPRDKAKRREQVKLLRSVLTHWTAEEAGQRLDAANTEKFEYTKANISRLTAYMRKWTCEKANANTQG